MAVALQRERPGMAVSSVASDVSTKVSVFRSEKGNVRPEVAFREAHAKGLVVLSNQSYTSALRSGQLDEVKSALPAAVGTAYAFVEEGKSFEKGSEKIDGHHYVIDSSPSGGRDFVQIPEQYLHEVNSIMLMNYPTYTIEVDGTDRFFVLRFDSTISPSFDPTIGLLERPFATASGLWFLPDPVFGIPQGNPVRPYSPGAMQLMLREKGAGQIIRAKMDFDMGGRAIIFFPWVSEPHSTLVESPVTQPD